jgi:hypothetical protein
MQALGVPAYYRLCVLNCSYLKETKAYCKNIVKTSKLLDEMAAKARAEVLRIEAARLEAHRLLLRRKAELSNLATGKRKSLITQRIVGSVS